MEEGVNLLNLLSEAVRLSGSGIDVDPRTRTLKQPDVQDEIQGIYLF